MSEIVQRFGLDFIDNHSAERALFKKGDFVLYSDYARVEAERNDLSEDRDYWQAKSSEQSMEFNSMKKKLEAERDEARNAVDVLRPSAQQYNRLRVENKVLREALADGVAARLESVLDGRTRNVG